MLRLRPVIPRFGDDALRLFEPGNDVGAEIFVLVNRFWIIHTYIKGKFQYEVAFSTSSGVTFA